MWHIAFLKAGVVQYTRIASTLEQAVKFAERLPAGQQQAVNPVGSGLGFRVDRLGRSTPACRVGRQAHRSPSGSHWLRSAMSTPAAASWS
jgi:hypothetical protein